MTQRKSAVLHIAVGWGLLCSTVFMASPTTAQMTTPESQQGSGDMKGMTQMMEECRAHHDKADKAIDQMMMKMEEGRRSNDATKMRATLEASQNGLAELKQDMAACKNMMSMMDKIESGMGGPMGMGEMGGMREGMGGMREGMGDMREGMAAKSEMNAMSETILITGGSGLIGYPLSQRLADQFGVIGFDRQGPPHPPSNVDCVSVDLTSDESLQHGLTYVRERYGNTLASVLHLAAYYDFSGEPSRKYDDITVKGTARLLKGLKAFQVEQFIFSSTMLVHAPCQPGQRINEDWPLEPKWAYPKSKVETETLIRAERGSIPVVLLRIASVYTDRCQSIPLAHQIQRIYERKLVSHVFPGHIAHGQAFLHLDDLIEAFVRLVQRRKRLPAALPLLVGEGETLSYDELQHQFGRLIHGEEWDTREIPKAVATAGAWLQDAMPGEEPFIKPWMIDLADDHYALDITRAHDLLGWRTKRSLRDTLPLMISALKEDPLVWYREHKLEPPSRLREAPAEATRGR